MTREEIQERADGAFDELVAALEQGKSEQLLRYLEMLAKFHRYSFGNCLLIALQMPQATHVAGFQRWKQLGRYVRQGEKGISILAPLIRKIRPQTEQALPEQEEQQKSEPGQAAAPARRLFGFKVAHVFDITQTDGEPLVEFASISGEPGDKLQRLESVIWGHGIELSYDSDLNGALGVSEGGRIRVLPTLAPAETFAVLAHELAHELLHRGDRRAETTKQIRETEAEAVAFVVCRASGIDSGDRSRDYIHLYHGDKDLLLQSLDYIQRVSTAILRQLEEGATAPATSAESSPIFEPTTAAV